MPPHFSPSSAGFAEGVGNIMQFTLSLNELSPITSPSALLCTGIAHTAALGVGFTDEMMHRTIGRPASTSMVCLWFVIPGAAEKNVIPKQSIFTPSPEPLPKCLCDGSACSLMGTFVFLEVELGRSAPVLAGTGSPTQLLPALGQRRAAPGSCGRSAYLHHTVWLRYSV